MLISFGPERILIRLLQSGYPTKEDIHPMIGEVCSPTSQGLSCKDGKRDFSGEENQRMRQTEQTAILTDGFNPNMSSISQKFSVTEHIYRCAFFYKVFQGGYHNQYGSYNVWVL